MTCVLQTAEKTTDSVNMGAWSAMLTEASGCKSETSAKSLEMVTESLFVFQYKATTVQMSIKCPTSGR